MTNKTPSATTTISPLKESDKTAKTETVVAKQDQLKTIAKTDKQEKAPSPASQKATKPKKSDKKEFDFIKARNVLFAVSGLPFVAGIAAGTFRGVMSVFWSILFIIAHGMPEGIMKYKEDGKTVEESIRSSITKFFGELKEKPFEPVYDLFKNIAIFLPIPEKYKETIIKTANDVQKADVDIFSAPLAGLGFTVGSIAAAINNPTFLNKKPKPEPEKTPEQKAAEAKEASEKQKQKEEVEAREKKELEDGDVARKRKENTPNPSFESNDQSSLNGQLVSASKEGLKNDDTPWAGVHN